MLEHTQIYNWRADYMIYTKDHCCAPGAGRDSHPHADSRCCCPVPICCPPQECACIPIPTPSQNGYVLTVVDNQYVPVPGTAADFEGQMRPADIGTFAWDYDPMFLESPVTQSGIIYLSKIFLHKTMTVSYIYFALMAQGALTAGQNFAGIYTSAGTLIVQSADQTGNWQNATGFIATPIPATTLEPGSYFIAFLFNSTEGTVGAMARQICGFQEITTGFNSRALQTASNTNISLPTQFTLADFGTEIDCNYLWSGLA